MKSPNVKVSIDSNNLVNQDNRLNEIVGRIVHVIKPNKVFLINSISAIYCCATNSLVNRFEIIAHYNLLVICSQVDDLHEVQESIETHCNPIIPVTALVLTQTMFDEYLLANPVLSNSPLLAGTLIYEIQDNLNAEISKAFKLIEVSKEGCEAVKRAIGFLASAELHLLRNELQLAAFALHQAIEQFCFGKILMTLGINPKTHNLDKLYRLMRFFTFDLMRIFPRDTEVEEKIFVAIKEAYIKSRYSTTCTFKSSDLKKVRDRLRILFKV